LVFGFISLEMLRIAVCAGVVPQGWFFSETLRIADFVLLSIGMLEPTPEQVPPLFIGALSATFLDSYLFA
jgi:hypothetical protein